MAGLGELERSVMDSLWDSPEPLTANDVRDRLADSGADAERRLAVTTVLTVLARLEKKGLVVRRRGTRPHHFSASSSREEHAVALMEDALGTASDRQAALVHFAGSISPADALALQRILAQRSAIAQQDAPVSPAAPEGTRR